MKIMLHAGLCCLMLQSVTAGTIVGTIHAKGLAAAQDQEAGGAYASRKYKDAETIDYDAIHDFVVYVDGPFPGTKPPTETRKVVQHGVEFVPHVLPVMVGTRVEWPNEDEIFHNVYSRSQASSFNLGLYKKGDQAKGVLFDKPGEVDVFCSIHAKMSCVVLVLENPYFANPTGRHYTITNVPAGTYKLVGWQERLLGRTNVVTVPETGEVKMDFELGPDAKP